MKKYRKHDKIPDDLVAKMMLESRRTCNLCWQKQAAHTHHILPLADGGDNVEDNLILLCNECHPEVHTRRSMARNITPATLRLYKETWLDLVNRFPLGTRDIIAESNDIEVIRKILGQGDRRALYFPLNIELPYQMFKSLNDFRLYIQSSGYRLLHSQTARDHIHQIYKALCEIEFLTPKRGEEECMFGILGRQNAEFFELRRKAICFHLNSLAQLIGITEGIFSDNEFEKMSLNIPASLNPSDAPPCFARFGDYGALCENCNYAQQCKECR